MNKGRRRKKNTTWEATIARNNQRTIRKHGGKVESVEMNGYKWKGGDGGEIINDIRRSYNLYKRPRFQRERNTLVTSNGLIGEVASPAHSVSGRILQAFAVTSSRECLLYRRRSGEQGEVDLRRSAQPGANVTISYNPNFNQSTSRYRTNPYTFPSILHLGASPQNEGINATRNRRKAAAINWKAGNRIHR